MASSIVIFGASGDLTSRKLIPALYRLSQRRRIDPETRIVGVSRTPLDDATWRKQLAESTAKYVGTSFDAESWSAFSQKIFYQPGDLSSSQDMQRLQQRLLEWEGDSASDRLYYLATMPQLYQTAVQQLGNAGMQEESQGARRLVVEKPFGTDLESARQLNDAIHQVFTEKQIYRIDHYLGKETVQNILVLRFGNSIFEPLWNHHYIDHVQITVAEEVTVGRRGDYYDQAGVLRDMFQNHLLQLMMVIAMEPPSRFDADLVRDEKVKVLHAVRPFRGSDFATGGVRGQYAGYLADPGVPKGSQTETFAALRLLIDNWRWKGVPFFLRSGKAMSCRTTQIVIQFREPPHFLFDQRESVRPEANRLVIQIQPAEGLQVHFQSKIPDEEMRMRTSELDFRFDQRIKEMPDAYQRLLQDAISGDASLFARSDEVEQAWRIVDPIIAAWKSPAAPPLQTYPVGAWGPEESNHWIEGFKRNWFDVCPIIR